MVGDQPVALPASGELTATARPAAELGKAAKSANTRRAYDADWRSFGAWCAENQLSALPVTPVTVGLYIAAIGAGAWLALLAARKRWPGLPFPLQRP